jgi:hypothetical protein
MPISAERILPGKCYKVAGSAPRRVLLIQEKKVTFILRGDMAWTVLRYHQDVETFARAVECEIDCMTLVDLKEELPS